MANDIDALRALLAKATQGPWTHAQSVSADAITALEGDYEIEVVSDVHRDDNAALIVAAVNALPSLCDEVERLRAEVERLKPDWHDEMDVI